MKLFALFLIFFCAFGYANSSLGCTECEYVATMVKVLVSNNQTVNQIETQLIAYCNLFTANSSSLCTTFVRRNVPQLIALVNKLDNPQKICQAVGLCTAQKNVQITGPKAEANCVLCTYLVGLADTWLTENATEERILGVFESACNILPGGAKYVCRAAVDQYGRELIQLLINKEDPNKVCQILGACPQKAVLKAGPIPCFLCKYVVQTVEAFVTSNSTEGEIIKLADKVCTVLPNKYRAPCESLVDIYITQVINLILQKENPATVCAAIHLCTSKIEIPNKLRPQHIVRPKLSATPQNCQVCQFLLLTIEGYLTANSTEQAVLGFTDAFCQKLGALSASCTQFAAAEVPALLQYVINKADPLTVCTKFGVCSASLKHPSVLSR